MTNLLLLQKMKSKETKEIVIERCTFYSNGSFCNKDAWAYSRGMCVCQKHFKILSKDNEKRFKKNIEIPNFDTENPGKASELLRKGSRKKL